MVLRLNLWLWKLSLPSGLFQRLNNVAFFRPKALAFSLPGSALIVGAAISPPQHHFLVDESLSQDTAHLGNPPLFLALAPSASRSVSPSPSSKEILHHCREGKHATLLSCRQATSLASRRLLSPFYNLKPSFLVPFRDNDPFFAHSEAFGSSNSLLVRYPARFVSFSLKSQETFPSFRPLCIQTFSPTSGGQKRRLESSFYISRSSFEILFRFSVVLQLYHIRLAPSIGKDPIMNSFFLISGGPHPGPFCAPGIVPRRFPNKFPPSFSALSLDPL